ncbi:hypothetical protein IFM89_039963 [Coptis chinensis]|uniref:F-ATPase protein 6 n=1 Tax=Coptis chinensis TaxID=261450 RepID=A0A835GVD0_9MAGN|nr:hypothetical protein IFM89_039963 [Coptis chinensis]
MQVCHKDEAFKRGAGLCNSISIIKKTRKSTSLDGELPDSFTLQVSLAQGTMLYREPGSPSISLGIMARVRLLPGVTKERVAYSPDYRCRRVDKMPDLELNLPLSRGAYGVSCQVKGLAPNHEIQDSARSSSFHSLLGLLRLQLDLRCDQRVKCEIGIEELRMKVICGYLLYTYDRSFRTHQETVQWAHEYGSGDGAKFFYKLVHVGHDGTTLESAPFPKEVGLAGTGTLPIDPASVTAQSPLEQFDILPLIPMNLGDFYFSFTNPSLSMLLTLSIFLLLVYLVTKKGGGFSVPNAWQSLVELIYDFVPNPGSFLRICFLYSSYCSGSRRKEETIGKLTLGRTLQASSKKEHRNYINLRLPCLGLGGIPRYQSIEERSYLKAGLRGGDFGIGSPVRRATALWLLYFSSSFLCNSIDQSPLVIGRPSRLAYDRRASKERRAAANRSLLD